MDPFEIKESDSIDQDLGLAGVDVEEMFAAITRDFATDFSELGDYFDLYFYPEVAAFSDCQYRCS